MIAPVSGVEQPVMVKSLLRQEPLVQRLALLESISLFQFVGKKPELIELQLRPLEEVQAAQPVQPLDGKRTQTLDWVRILDWGQTPQPLEIEGLAH